MPVAKASEIPVGQVYVFRVQGQSLAIANVNGEFFAIDNVCTHDGGPLGEGMVIGDQVECPRHGARFDVRTGVAKRLPAVLPVRTYELRLSGEDIEVRLDE